MGRKLLITGFDAFGDGTINPSWESVWHLPDIVGDFVLCKLQIPTIFGVAAQTVLQKAREFQPDVILCVGLAGGRDAVTPERIAVNIRDARIPDNAGHHATGQPVVEGAPAAYFATVPVNAMAQAIRDAQIPGAVSNTAGTFVCNDTLFHLLHHCHGTDVKVGFIHVPYLPQQGTPSLPLESMVVALKAAIIAC